MNEELGMRNEGLFFTKKFFVLMLVILLMTSKAEAKRYRAAFSA